LASYHTLAADLKKYEEKDEKLPVAKKQKKGPPAKPIFDLKFHRIGTLRIHNHTVSFLADNTN
jgi:hypothetical protein